MIPDYLSFAVQNARSEFKRPAPYSYGLSPTHVLIADPEFQTERLITGWLVYVNNEHLAGELWHDGEQFCWRTLDEQHFGRDRDQSAALRALAAVA